MKTNVDLNQWVSLEKSFFLLFLASLTTGDRPANSVRLSTMKEIGQVDVIVQAETREVVGQLGLTPPGQKETKK